MNDETTFDDKEILKTKLLQIGQNISQIRKNKRISMYLIENKSGVTRSNVYALEKAKWPVNIVTLLKVLDVLDCKLIIKDNEQD